MVMGIDPGAEESAAVIVDSDSKIIYSGIIYRGHADKIFIQTLLDNITNELSGGTNYLAGKSINPDSMIVVLECPWLTKSKGRAQRYSKGGQSPLMG